MSPAAQKKDARLATDTALLRVLGEATGLLRVGQIAELMDVSHRVARPALNRLRHLELVQRVRAGKHSAWLWSVVK